MSSQRGQQSGSSSSHRSRSARGDQRASITVAQFEALNISSHTPPPSIAVHRSPEYAPSNLSSFDSNLGIPVSQGQGDWPPAQMTATLDPSTSSLPFCAGLPNPDIGYSNFPMRHEQYPTETMSNTFDYNLPPRSSGFAQQNYYYPAPAHPQLPEYGTGNIPPIAHEFQGNFESHISPPLPSPGTVLPDGLINVSPPDNHPYSLEPSHISTVRRSLSNRRSGTPTGPTTPHQLSRPSSRQDEYLHHAVSSHSATESYHNISANAPSLTPDYMGHPSPGIAGHPYPASPSLYDPSLHPYQSSRQYSFSPGSDAGVPATSAPADGFSTPYSVSPGPEDQVRVVNSRPKPQCWDHGCNGREFSTFSNLLRHQREKAGTATKSECPHCGTVFTRTTARNGHLAQGKCKAKRAQS
ncbi:hypothetical protein FQN53_000377 [Emmonsiellopsis sp. PD_33]|nr:hypothetical protein FQN53_000377 [Emmonsiellopsis sp. PD_33]KAK2803463.1 hypothetical protein FQN51_003571 [Onygenales sp. PD_10]